MSTNTATEKMKQWRVGKIKEGWRALYMIVPPELATILLKVKAQYKIDNRQHYKKF